MLVLLSLIIESIYLVEKYECNDKNELYARERYWLEELKATLNSLIPNRSDKEYRLDNKDKNKEWREDNKEQIKQYRLDNKQKIKEYYKQYNLNNNQKFNCECGGKYTLNHRVRHFKTKKHIQFLENKNFNN